MKSKGYCYGVGSINGGRVMASLSVLFGFGALKRRKLRFLEEKIVEKGARDRLMVLWRSVMVCGRVEV